MSQNGVSNRMLPTSAGSGAVVVGGGACASPGGGSLGLLEHQSNNHTTHSSSSMNHISSSQSAAASWSHSHVGSNQIVNGLTISHTQSHSLHQQQQKGPGCTGADYDAATAVMAVSAAPQSPQSSSSSQTGTSLKEHDLLGLSEVSSSTTNHRLEAANCVQNRGAFHNQSDDELNLNLNLGSTELRLGGPPQDAGRSSGRGGHVDDGHGADQGPPACVGDRRSATVEQQQVLDRNCGYGGLMGVGGGNGFLSSRGAAAAADVAEGTRRGPSLREGEPLQKWHSGGGGGGVVGGGMVDSGKFYSNEGSRLDLSSLQQQQQQQQQQANKGGKQRLVSEENIHHHHHRPLASSWLELVEPQQQQQQSVGHRQEVASSVERVGLGMGMGMGMGMGYRDRQQMVDGVEVASLDQQQQQRVQRLEDQQQQHERVGHDTFLMEKRNLSDGDGVEALATPPPGRHLDYVTTSHPKLWQSPVLRPAADSHASQQPHPYPHPQQQQGQLGGASPFPPSSGMIISNVPALSFKPGMTGAKRPFDSTGIISDPRNFTDGRGGSGTGAGGCAGLPNPAAAVVGNSSAITSNSSSTDPDTKSRTHQLQQHQQHQHQHQHQHQQQQVPHPSYHHQSPWSSDSKPGGVAATATGHHSPWHVLHTGGGSFGPFPYQAPGRNASMPPMEVAPAPAVAARAPSAGPGGDPAHKSWETHTNAISKTLHDPVAAAATSSCSIGQKQQSQPPILSEAKPPGGAATQVPSPCTEAASAPRTAAAPPAAVGWPPLRNFRKGAIAARPSPVDTNKPANCVAPPAAAATAAVAPPTPPPQAASPVSVASHPNAWFVKVYMDGVPIGRKVDLKTNCSYEKLSLILEDYFRGYVTGQNPGQSSRDGGVALLPSDKRRFLHGSDYVLTYEDQEGDLMLVGDVPWTLFIDNVKRLRIMKGSEAIGLGARTAEKVNNKVQPTV